LTVCAAIKNVAATFSPFVHSLGCGRKEAQPLKIRLISNQIVINIFFILQPSQNKLLNIVLSPAIENLYYWLIMGIYYPTGCIDITPLFKLL